MKLIQFLRLGIFSMLPFLFYQCDTEQMSSNGPSLNNDPSYVSPKDATLDSDDALVLGEQLENPYSVINMNKAYNSLKEKNVNLNDFVITSNYHYVRILPTTDYEYNSINADTTLDLYEYPLDYEIVKRGNVYHDQTVRDNIYTWLYAAVPLDKEFDGKLKVEILEELFLPFGNGKEPLTEFQISEKDFLLNLEQESLRLTNNSSNRIKSSTDITTWEASGRIRVWDDLVHYNETTGALDPNAGYVPVVGCLVRANRWFTTITNLSDTVGNFEIDHEWGNGDSVNFSIKWDRDEFDIRSGSWGQAYYDGPKILGEWNLNIEEAYTPLSYLYAHAHRAAYTYYYLSANWDIQPPAQPWFTDLVWNQSKIHIGVNDNGNRSHFFTWNSVIYAAQVKLTYDLSANDSRDVFATAIHELAHTSHWQLGFTTAHYALLGNHARLAESWAQAVGWQLTNDVYSAVLEDPEVNSEGYQRMALAYIQESGFYYTPLFIDLIDDYNQHDSYDSSCPDDEASGYTLSQLEDFLEQEPTSWDNYRNYLRDHSSNPTEIYALWLFDNYTHQ